MKRECTPDQQHGRRVRQANDIWRNLVNHHLRGLFLLLPLLLCGVASAAEPKIVIPRMAEAPTIDGKLAPGEWKGAAEVAGMIDQFERTAHARQATFWIGYDDQNVYVAQRSTGAAKRVVAASAANLGTMGLDGP